MNGNNGMMRVPFSCFLLSAVLACSAPKEMPAPVTPPPTSPAPSPSPTTSSAPAEPAPPPPPPARERNIYIDAVEVANPVVITGRARTFENSVALRVRNARGAVIAESFTTSNGEMGQHNPYRATVWLNEDPGARITVEALEYSAKDGSPQSLVKLDKPFTVAPIDAQLSFGTKECAGTVTATRRMPKSLSHARLLVEALLRGPNAAEKARGMVNPFPEGSGLRSVNLREGVLTVDFNERLQNVGGSCPAQLIRQTVTETLRRLPSVKRVVITAGGSEKLALQP
jgi:hypothetical protein